MEPTVRVIPAGRSSETLSRDEEALQRAVEGRAASDEEEEVRVKEEGPCCLLEVNRLINKLHNCTKGCQKMALCRLLLSQNPTGRYSKPVGCSGPTESKTKGRKQNMPLGEKKTEEGISRRTLAKILLNTLDLCSAKGQESIPIVQVIDAVCQQLVCVEEDMAMWRGANPRHQNATNALLISC